ncbi:MAG TPA: hypothetical protein VF184_13010 [Phycisphaeraceae bacterium]
MLPQNQSSTASVHPSTALAPWPVRLTVYLVLVLIALGAIWLIDQRVVLRMKQMEAAPAAQTQP